MHGLCKASIFNCLNKLVILLLKYLRSGVYWPPKTQLLYCLVFTLHGCLKERLQVFYSKGNVLPALPSSVFERKGYLFENSEDWKHYSEGDSFKKLQVICLQWSVLCSLNSIECLHDASIHCVRVLS